MPQERQGSTEPAVEEIRPPARESPLEGCWVLGELAANSVRRLALGELAANLGGDWRAPAGELLATGEHRLPNSGTPYATGAGAW